MEQEMIEYKDYGIEIEQEDESGDSPRDWDNLGTMICWHNRYNLGDIQLGKRDKNKDFFYDRDDLATFLNRKDVLFLRLYLYDHSGLAINTTGFHDPWDSGLVGYIYVTKETILKEYGGKILTQNLKKRVMEYLDNEVKTYDQYLTGDVWGYRVFDLDDDGEKVEDSKDSCWGFYGYDYCLTEAKSVVDWKVQHNLEVQTELPAFMI